MHLLANILWSPLTLKSAYCNFLHNTHAASMLSRKSPEWHLLTSALGGLWVLRHTATCTVYSILTDLLQVQEEHCDPPRSCPASSCCGGDQAASRAGRAGRTSRGSEGLFTLRPSVRRGDRAGLRSPLPLGKWSTFLNSTYKCTEIITKRKGSHLHNHSKMSKLNASVKGCCI